MSGETGGGDGEWAGSRPPRRDKRLYFVLMGICIGLFVLSWAVVDRYSTTAAVIMTIVALVIPPFAAIVANAYSAADRRRRGPGADGGGAP
jgi:lipopolysaccharide export LptBFGC system permease protein LptF